MEKITNNTNPNEQTTELECRDFTLTVKTNPGYIDKLACVEAVVKDAFIDSVSPSLLLKNMSFAINFVRLICPDFDFPTTENEDGETVIDFQGAYDLIEENDILNLYDLKMNNLVLGEMELYVNNRVDFETKMFLAYIGGGVTGEAIENVSLMVKNINRLLDTAVTQLEKNGDKLFKKLTPKNISKWVNTLSEKYLETLKDNGGGENGDEV